MLHMAKLLPDLWKVIWAQSSSPDICLTYITQRRWAHVYSNQSWTCRGFWILTTQRCLEGALQGFLVNTQKCNSYGLQVHFFFTLLLLLGWCCLISCRHQLQTHKSPGRIQFAPCILTHIGVRLPHVTDLFARRFVQGVIWGQKSVTGYLYFSSLSSPALHGTIARAITHWLYLDQDSPGDYVTVSPWLLGSLSTPIILPTLVLIFPS